MAKQKNVQSEQEQNNIPANGDMTGKVEKKHGFSALQTYFLQGFKENNTPVLITTVLNEKYLAKIVGFDEFIISCIAETKTSALSMFFFKSNLVSIQILNEQSYEHYKNTLFEKKQNKPQQNKSQNKQPQKKSQPKPQSQPQQHKPTSLEDLVNTFNRRRNF